MLHWSVCPAECEWELHVGLVRAANVDVTYWEELPDTARPAHTTTLQLGTLPQAVPFKTVDVPGLLRLQVLFQSC